MIRWLLETASRWAAHWSQSTRLRVGRTLGFLMGHVFRVRRRAVLAALARCFPERTEAERRTIASGVYRHLGTMAAECLSFPGQPYEVFQQYVDFEGKEHIQDALAQGRGMLILMGHIGNWEMLGLALAGRWTRVSVIVRTQRNAAFDAFWRESREKMGLRPLPGQHSFREVLRLLKQGEMVAVTLDQNMRRRRGIFVNFFGKPACTTPGLAYLAAHSGAPVVPLYIIRQPNGHHVVHALPALPPPPDREEATILAATQTYSNILENIIRQHPEQWLWLHNRWRTRPEQPIPPSRRVG